MDKENTSISFNFKPRKWWLCDSIDHEDSAKFSTAERLKIHGNFTKPKRLTDYGTSEFIIENDQIKIEDVLVEFLLYKSDNTPTLNSGEIIKGAGKLNFYNETENMKAFFHGWSHIPNSLFDNLRIAVLANKPDFTINFRADGFQSKYEFKENIHFYYCSAKSNITIKSIELIYGNRI